MIVKGDTWKSKIKLVIMTLTSPVSNMLAVIRNAIMRKHSVVTFPHSNFKWAICQQLVKNNYLKGCQCLEEKQSDFVKKRIEVRLIYDKNGVCRIHQIEGILKPSQHIHLKISGIRKKSSQQRKGMYILSTSQGLLNHQEALQKNTGGKLVLFVK